MSINQKWRNEMCLILTMEYYLAIKSNDALIHTTSWTNLVNTVISDGSQSQKNTYCMIPFI